MMMIMNHVVELCTKLPVEVIAKIVVMKTYEVCNDHYNLLLFYINKLRLLKSPVTNLFIYLIV